jgi:hypothetical protein
LALSTDIIFPYRHLEPRDASDKVRELHVNRRGVPTPIGELSY